MLPHKITYVVFFFLLFRVVSTIPLHVSITFDD